MTSEDTVSNKITTKPRTPLRRSASTTSIGLMFTTHLSLRDTKSYTGGMEGSKSESSEENEEVSYDRLGELTANKNLCAVDEIETRDAITNEIVNIKSKMLQHGGKKYDLNGIAHIWKKDCRIWLWKNGAEFKKNKSVGEKIKAGYLKIKDYSF